MLVCDCGWKGTNLLPNWKHDTAHCPECLTVFQGIKADDAQVMSESDEREIVTDQRRLSLFVTDWRGQSRYASAPFGLLEDGDNR